MSDNKEKKCTLKCKTCVHYNRVSDYCREKDIRHCSKEVNTNFSQCESYLVRENLIWF